MCPSSTPSPSDIRKSVLGWWNAGIALRMKAELTLWQDNLKKEFSTCVLDTDTFRYINL